MKRLLFTFLLLAVSALAQSGGAGAVLNQTFNCGTSTDGSVVGISNPLTQTNVAPQFTGTLPAGNYYVQYSWYDFLGKQTLVSPESVVQLTSQGGITVALPPVGLPQGAAGMRVYIGAASGTETLQGATSGTASFIQSVPLVSGAAPPGANTTACRVVANDAVWPVGTGYNVGLTDSEGNATPGYPMQWQLMGPNTTIDLSRGLPYFHGNVFYPTPIQASPQGHATQSIAGALAASKFIITGAGGVNSTGLTHTVTVPCGTLQFSGGILVAVTGSC